MVKRLLEYLLKNKDKILYAKNKKKVIERLEKELCKELNDEDKKKDWRLND